MLRGKKLITSGYPRAASRMAASGGGGGFFFQRSPCRHRGWGPTPCHQEGWQQGYSIDFY
jgi:hypothetical protein